MELFDALGARRDEQTVTADGTPIQGDLFGVMTRSVTTHVDFRGRLFEVVNFQRDPEFWQDQVIHSYVFTVRRGTLKGWGVHEHKADRYCLISGETLTLLYDGRPSSPTFQWLQRVTLTPEGTRMVLIPPGVWHLSINLAPAETLLLNCPTEAYNYEAPDRLTLPWDTDRIPVDVASYFPHQWRSPAS